MSAERMSATKLALAGRSLWARDGALRLSEPIAVVGMGCRFPGGVSDPESLWQLVLEGGDAMTEVPFDRWDNADWFDPDPATPGKVSTRWGGFLDDIRGFDAAFFDISPREAERMDPQQRLALEVACEAIEHAGIPLDALRGSATGVYFSSYHNDYTFLQYADLASVNGRTLTGTLHSVIPNRLSYALGLRGPSLTVDSACSSSLVACHLACQALRNRDCETALVGGINLMITPHVTVALSRGGFMSPTGHCWTFDQAADGFVRSEGCGVVVLRRLADAIADGDRVLGVIRGSAVNQDGESTTLSAPNGLAQAAMVARALENAGLTPADISLLEAHGTGTQLGDPIETDALASVFGRRDPSAGTCWLGSLKSNLGHMEAAAGVGGLIKAILCLQHATVPPHALFTEQNPHVELAGTPFRIAREATPLTGAAPRRAGVSAFGVGGTNAHVIVEEAPAALQPAVRSVEPPFLLPVSARSGDALRALAGRYASIFRRGDDPGPVAMAAARRRIHHREFRVGVVGSDAEALLAALDRVAGGAHAPGTQDANSADPPLCFVFSGQGTQWAGMGLALRDRSPAFREELEAIDRLFAERGDLRPVAELERPADESRLARTDVAQATVFALQVALTRLLAGYGIRPAVVVGHSVGELAAAVTSGRMTLEEGVEAVLVRGSAMQSAFDSGRMVAVRLTREAAMAFLDRHRLALTLAAENGPSSVVLSGEAGVVEEACQRLASEDVRHTLLDVRFAFHSPLMAEAAERVRSSGGGFTPAASEVAFVSTVSGAEAERLDYGYLADNVASPVRFRDAVSEVLGRGVRHFIEIGPHPALGSMIAETASAADVEVGTGYAQHRERDAFGSILELMGRAYAWGCDPEWDAVYPGRCAPVDLPTYPWAHRPYWLPSSPPPTLPSQAVPSGGGGLRRLRSPALTRPVLELVAGDPLFRAFADHVVGGVVRVPATGLLELLREAGRTLGLVRPQVVAAGVVRAVEPHAIRSLQIVLNGDGTGPVEIVAESLNGDWFTAVTAELREGERLTRPDGEGASGGTGASWPSTGPEPVGERAAAALSRAEGSSRAPLSSPDELYAAIASAGLEFGPGYRLLESVRADDLCAEGTLDVDGAPPWAGEVNPALLDAAAHLCIAILRAGGGLDDGRAHLPWAVDGIHRLAGGEVATGRAVLRASGPSGTSFDVFLLDEGGRPLVWLEGWHLRPTAVGSAVLREATWVPQEVGDPEARESGAWLILGSADGLAGKVARGLEAAGQSATLLDPAHPDEDRGLESVLEEGAWRGVVDLTALADGEGGEGNALVARATAHCRPLLTLARQSARGSTPGPDRATLDGLRVLLVTRGLQSPAAATGADSAAAAALGLMRSLRVEAVELVCTSLDLDPAVGSVDAGDDLLIVREALTPQVAHEVMIRDGERRVHHYGLPELRVVDPGEARPVALRHGQPGVLDGFHLVPLDLTRPAPGEVTVRVLAAGLNFRDLLVALDSYPGKAEMGLECCGVVEAVGDGEERLRVGDRVVAFWPGAFASKLNVPSGFVHRAPPGLDPTAAATLPVAFGTAWFALVERGELMAGQSVLIHAGAGGVGQAAIQLALARGARVFATAGTPEKRAWLERCGVSGAFDSRSASFERDVMEATGGEGVDLVVNSLIGELLAASFRCVKAGGRFVELGKRETLTPEEASAHRPDLAYGGFDLRDSALANPTLLPRIFSELRDRVADGSLRPLPAYALPLAEAEGGFRRMARGHHVGKIVFLPPPGRVSLDSGWTVLTGATGGMGAATLQWLLAAGARRVALWSRNAPASVQDDWAAMAARHAAEVVTQRVDVADRAGMEGALAELRASAPICGVVHAAGVVDDGTLSKLSEDRLEAVLRPKLAGAWNLHEATLEDPLEAFVLYSSAGPLVDARGTGSYAAANACLDALAVHRRASGRPAVSLRWGLYRGGMSERMEEREQERWLRAGLRWMDHTQGGLAFDAALAADSPVLHLVELASEEAKAPAREAESVASAELAGRLSGLADHQQEAVTLEFVRNAVSTMLGLAEPADPQAPLRDLGLDSLSAIELRNALTVAAGESLPATLAFDYPTAAAIATFLLGRMRPGRQGAADEPGSGAGAGAGPAAGAGDGPRDHADVRARTSDVSVDERVDSLSEAEAEALLLQELAAGRAGSSEDDQ